MRGQVVATLGPSKLALRGPSTISPAPKMNPAPGTGVTGNCEPGGQRCSLSARPQGIRAVTVVGDRVGDCVGDCVW